MEINQTKQANYSNVSKKICRLAYNKDSVFSNFILTLVMTKAGFYLLTLSLQSPVLVGPLAETIGFLIFLRDTFLF